jgi:hypothetical protein
MLQLRQQSVFTIEEHFIIIVNQMAGMLVFFPRSQIFVNWVLANRWYYLERNLNRNSELKQQYYDFIEGYIQLGHMILSSQPTNNNFS